MFTEASLCEHHTLGLTNPDVNFNRMHQLFCYMTIVSCLAAVTKVMMTVARLFIV